MTRRERDLRRLARAHGWTVERTKGGQWLLVHPDGHRVVASWTPSDWRHLRAVEGCLRRAVRNGPPLDQTLQSDVANKQLVHGQ